MTYAGVSLIEEFLQFFMIKKGKGKSWFLSGRRARFRIGTEGLPKDVGDELAEHAKLFVEQLQSDASGTGFIFPVDHV